MNLNDKLNHKFENIPKKDIGPGDIVEIIDTGKNGKVVNILTGFKGTRYVVELAYGEVAYTVRDNLVLIKGV